MDRKPYEYRKTYARVMQDFIDMDNVQYKKMAKWDLSKEHLYKNMTINDYMFHIWAIQNYYDS